MLLFVILGAKVIKRCKLCKKKQSIFRILMYLCAQHKVTLHMNIRMNIILSAGIIIARYGYDQMPPVLWLILLLVMTGMAIILRKWILSQHILLYICMFLLGGLLTSYQEYREQKPDTYFTIDELSELDRFQITAQERRAETEQKMKGLGIENEDFGVITAMALGDKTALDKDTKEVYSVAGANHVLAVSGLHISIIFQLLIMLLGGNRRHIFVIFSALLAIWMYVLFIGVPASAVRSATMLSVYGFVMMTRRKGESLHLLSTALTFMLLWNPLYLFDLSFQMSFAAVGSIIVFMPLLSSLYHPAHRLSQWIWSMLCVSAAAQIGTLPLITYYFGRISCYSLLTTFIAIPAATGILYLCCMLMLLSPFLLLSPTVAPASWLTSWIAKALVSITHFANTAFHLISLAPGASIDGIHLPLPALFCIYAVIGLVYAGWVRIKRIRNKMARSQEDFSPENALFMNHR